MSGHGRTASFSEHAGTSVRMLQSGREGNARNTFEQPVDHNHNYSSTDSSADQQTSPSLLLPTASGQPDITFTTTSATETESQEQVNTSHQSRNRRRRGIDSAVASPSRANVVRRRRSTGNDSLLSHAFHEYNSSVAESRDPLAYDPAQSFPDQSSSTSRDLRSQSPRGGTTSRRPPSASTSNSLAAEWNGYSENISTWRKGESARPGFDRLSFPMMNCFDRSVKPSMMQLLQEKLAAADSKDVNRALISRDAVAVMLYRNESPDPEANDIWPNSRSSSKLPTRYYLVDKVSKALKHSTADRVGLEHSSSSETTLFSKRNNNEKLETKNNQTLSNEQDLPDVHTGRPIWNLPVELVELIAAYLNRDDIKSLRMVSHELNHYISQVIFKTVVVPFNTEIYGMLGQEQSVDIKGKKRARFDKLEYFWKNTNGDEVYDGHGLDVFKGFGKHILRYGMSFEVSEASLSKPPAKLHTKQLTSFWGNYDWPFDEYRRFEAVAGLETAADETPRMTTAFSELTRVKELALSVDSGLGWLNGPDRSIRARVLYRPPEVFGTLKAIPDRRAQAQKELWDYIERCHQAAASDIKVATLYRLEGIRSLSAAEEISMLALEQPEMPYLDPYVVNEATPATAVDTPSLQVPVSFEDPEVLDRFILSPPTSTTGFIFSSTIPPVESDHVRSPIIPTNLTKAQKEWLLETEWAQRAFMSSYMLSIIDNPHTFAQVHTLNISRLSDRYLAMFDRADFWNGLPNLQDLTLLVIPGWRSVYKDEAGFVETPKLNPTKGVDIYYDLLRSRIAYRSGIRKLTLGWIGGGEHAEGLHARNKLLMPAPLMPLHLRSGTDVGSATETMTELDSNKLRSALLQFPFVEQLTLRNCWITPAALLQFVECHDKYQLQRLTWDSVSLTAVLRPVANPNLAPQAAGANLAIPPVAGQQGAGAWLALLQAGGQGAIQAQAQPQPNHNQILQIVVQGLLVQLQQLQGNVGNVAQQVQVAALQHQLQHQLLQLQTQNQNQLPTQPPMIAPPPVQPQAHGALHVAALPAQTATILTALMTQVQAIQQQIAPPAAPVPVAAQAAPANPAIPQLPADPQSILKAQPREGSWMNIIDIISPGTNLRHFGSTHSRADAGRQTSLRSVEFLSCGYAKLPHLAIDQVAIDPGLVFASTPRDSFFAHRRTALGPAMLSSKWTHLGEIVQQVDAAELAALDAGWNLKTGWDDAEEARAVEFDGLLPGGTGRITGVVRREDRVVEGATATIAT